MCLSFSQKEEAANTMVKDKVLTDRDFSCCGWLWRVICFVLNKSHKFYKKNINVNMEYEATTG